MYVIYNGKLYKIIETYTEGGFTRYKLDNGEIVNASLCQQM